MYLSLGPNTILSYGEIVGIFDLDNVSQSYRTRQFLDQAEKEGELNTVGEDDALAAARMAPTKEVPGWARVMLWPSSMS